MTKNKLKKHLRYLVPEIRLALIKEPSSSEALEVYSPTDLERYVEPLKFYSEEFFVALHLNVRNQIVAYNVVSHGTISASLVHPREVFKAAILSNSHAIIVAHNHPGGSLLPSSEDLATTVSLIEAGKLLGIGVIDHVIVASSGIQSLRELLPHMWT